MSVQQEIQQATTHRWLKSSHSTGNGACVEVRSPAAQHVAVRDSKDTSRTPLAFGQPAWLGFLRQLDESGRA